MTKAYDTLIETAGQVVRYRVTRDGASLLYSEVLELWQHDERFVDHFIGLLTDSPFQAYRWETPSCSRHGE